MNALEKFGEVYIKEVRDNTMETFEKIFDGRMKGLTAQSIQEKLSEFAERQREKILWFITKAVDQSMHNMLFMMEEHKELQVIYDMENIVEDSDGLSGELYTDDGWIKKYSKKPYEE